MVLLTSPHFLLVTRVGILRVHPETSVLKATCPPPPRMQSGASVTLRPTVWVLDSAEMHLPCLMAWEPEIPSCLLHHPGCF